MRFFRDDQAVYITLGGMLEALVGDPEVAPRLRSADTVVRYELRAPDARITLKLRREEEPLVEFGISTLRPEVVLAMEADTAHRYFLGETNPTVALSRGEIRARGPVAKVLALIPLAEPAFALYRERLEAAGQAVDAPAGEDAEEAADAPAGEQAPDADTPPAEEPPAEEPPVADPPPAEEPPVADAPAPDAPAPDAPAPDAPAATPAQ